MTELRRAAARRALAALDLTDLSDTADEAGLDRLCARAVTPEGAVAAVCVWPRFVAGARAALAGTGVKIATVANFPAGGEEIAPVRAEIERSLVDGADEIDVVIPWRALKDGREAPVVALVAAARAAAQGRTLKTILESGELADAAIIEHASRLALDAGADFLKTSTGKTKVSATPEAAGVMLRAIAAQGGRAGFKASGGVRTLDDALVYLDLAQAIIGTTGPDRFRIGASGLLDALLAELGRA
jgi:deoxyribose-phosphate aldolase